MRDGLGGNAASLAERIDDYCAKIETYLSTPHPNPLGPLHGAGMADAYKDTLETLRKLRAQPVADRTTEMARGKPVLVTVVEEIGRKSLALANDLIETTARVREIADLAGVETDQSAALTHKRVYDSATPSSSPSDRDKLAEFFLRQDRGAAPWPCSDDDWARAYRSADGLLAMWPAPSCAEAPADGETVSTFVNTETAEEAAARHLATVVRVDAVADRLLAEGQDYAAALVMDALYPIEPTRESLRAALQARAAAPGMDRDGLLARLVRARREFAGSTNAFAGAVAEIIEEAARSATERSENVQGRADAREPSALADDGERSKGD